MTEKIKVGIVGCGNISPAYFKGCALFDILDVVACADMDMERARARATEYNVQALSVDELLAHPEIRIVVNLTTPQSHAPVSLAAIAAGKNVHEEKPFALRREDGEKILAAAQEKGVLVGCAPDTFLGGGIQTCRKLIDDGVIGEPVAATAFMAIHGHESWHPNPEFYYHKGGGPMFDMGPYYLTALVNLIGRITRVTGSTRRTFSQRTITSKPQVGKLIDVEVTTHLAGVVDFANGAIGTIIMSFDVWSHTLPLIEIYGSEGTMRVPDPNDFKGPVLVRRAGEREWSEMPLTHSDQVSRGIGVADMAYALVYGRPHRVSGALAHHVLDVMQAFDEASESGQHVAIGSTVERPAPLPTGLALGQLDR
jgi:predicted dehydrogenase